MTVSYVFDMCGRTETDADVEVRVPLPPGTAAKSVQLSVTKSSLTLGLKGREGPVLKVCVSNIERREGRRERTIFFVRVVVFFYVYLWFCSSFFCFFNLVWFSFPLKFPFSFPLSPCVFGVTWCFSAFSFFVFVPVSFVFLVVCSLGFVAFSAGA